MKTYNTLEPVSGPQLFLVFEPRALDGLSELKRAKVVLTLAQIMMQAAGLAVEEFVDDRH